MRGNLESEYRRRIRKNAENKKHHADDEQRDKRYQEGIQRVIGAIGEIRSRCKKNNNEEDRRWRCERNLHVGEIAALILAAIVGIAAICVGSYDSNKSIRLANRAWLNPLFAHIGGPLKKGDQIRYTIDYQNAGRSPAANINWGFTTGFFDPPPNDDGSKITIPPNTTCAGLRPNIGGTIEYAPAQNVPHNERGPHSISGVSEKDILIDDAMLSGTRRFYVQGCAAYNTMDIEGRSAFCFYYVLVPGNADLRACPGNSAK